MKKPNLAGCFATYALLLFASTSLDIQRLDAQVLPTNGSIDTKYGKLELENGYPRTSTVEKVFDDIDYQRACQAYLWGLPLMAMQQWQKPADGPNVFRAITGFVCIDHPG